MSGRLAGRKALVTGAGRGLGREIALGLAREGADVVVHYNRSHEGARAVAEEIAGLGRQAHLVRADLTSCAEIEAMAAEAFAHWGRLDVLVNNVGDVAPEQQSWREVTEELVDRVLAVDIKGTMFTTHEIGRRMLEQERGAIVNVCSNVVVTGSARAPQYAASKYGVLGLTKSYAAAFAPDVRVNALGPGYVETETTLARADWRGGRRDWVLERTPLKRIPAPQEIVGTVLFLASDDSSHMTGAFVLCDGGFSMVGA
ncbi:MAG: SDR family oxidoreductase [Solirubrobacterales bacterium]|nr:SDR family oxidoreductase [Solirubrobacterales bacterium]